MGHKNLKLKDSFFQLTDHKKLESAFWQKQEQKDKFTHEAELYDDRINRYGIVNSKFDIFDSFSENPGRRKDAENVAHNNHRA